MSSITYFKKARVRYFWLLQGLLWYLTRLVPQKLIRSNSQLTIGITTFADRFESCLIPLINQVREIFPEAQIIVAANGDVNQKKQEEYLIKLREFCRNYSNLLLIDHEKPVGLSKLWNMLIINTVHERVLILNDDLKLAINFGKFIETSGILEEDIALLKKSWSHFLISKELFQKVGYFDERLLEIGGEDDDYAARCELLGIEIRNYPTNLIASRSRRRHRRIKINSYGKDMSKERGGYSTYNSIFIRERKWITSDTPFAGAIFVPNRKPKYWKMRVGMETPDFYPNLDKEKGES